MNRTLRAAGSILVLALAGLPSCSSRPPRDVVLLTLDTLRADRLGCYGHPGGLSPRLDGLALEGIVFEDASAPTPITLPSHASLLTGRYPTATGVRNNGTFLLPEAERTLAEILSDAGYWTGAVIGAFPLHSRFGLDQGFGSYDDALPAPSSGDGGIALFFAERRAEEVTDRAIAAWRNAERSPRFLWAHYFDPHAPYDAPAPWGTRHADEPYAGEVAYLDAQVGRLLDAILEDAPDAIVVVTADHGESLGEHGEKTHGVFLYQSTLHVPLLVRAPGLLDAGARVGEPVSLVDVLPTVLRLAGLDPSPDVHGTDLVEIVLGTDRPSRPVYAESYLPRLQFRFSELKAMREGPLKYIDAPRPELYDVAQDPDEERNLAGGHPDESRIAAELRGWVASADPDADDRALGSLDPETEAKLRSLGYASAGTLAPGREGRGRDPKDMTDYLRRYDQAVGAISRGRFDEGIAELRALVPEAPENYMVHYQIAAGFLASGREAEAEESLLRVVEAAPEFASGYLMLAEVQGRLGKVDRAVETYAAAAAALPGVAEPFYAKGLLLESFGRFEEAADAFAEALDREPRNEEIASRLLGHYASRGRPEAAVAALEALTSRHPRSGALWTALADARSASGDVRGAAGAIDRALEAEPGHAPALVRRGELFLALDEPERARASFRKAVELRPDDLRARFGLGRALLDLDRLSDARAEFAHVLAEEPRFVGVHLALGAWHERRGEVHDAIASYRSAVAADPGNRAAAAALVRLRANP